MCSFFSFKKTAAAAVAALILPFTHAASDDASPRSGVVIFGQMDIGSAGSKTERGHVTTEAFSLAGASPRTDSFIGFEASESLSNTVSAGAVLELEINSSTGRNGNGTRQAYLFLIDQDLGGLRIGTFHNAFSGLRDMSPTSQSVIGGKPTLRHSSAGQGRFGRTSQNAIDLAASPALLGGVVVSITGAAENVRAVGAIGNGSTNEQIILAATYAANGWQAGLVHGESKVHGAWSLNRMQNTAAGVTYSAGNWTLGAIGEHMRNGDGPAWRDTQALEVFATHSMGAVDYFVSFGHLDSENQHAQSWRTATAQAGLVKHISARTSFHVAAGIEQTRGAVTGQSTGYGVGLTHAF